MDRLFFDRLKYINFGGQNVLLTCDAYIVHLSMKFLEIFNESGIIFYELPALTSGKALLCDVVLFSFIKETLNCVVFLTLAPENACKLENFSFYVNMCTDYNKTLSRANFVSSFNLFRICTLYSTIVG